MTVHETPNLHSAEVLFIEAERFFTIAAEVELGIHVHGRAPQVCSFVSFYSRHPFCNVDAFLISRCRGLFSSSDARRAQRFQAIDCAHENARDARPVVVFTRDSGERFAITLALLDGARNLYSEIPHGIVAIELHDL